MNLCEHLRAVDWIDVIANWVASIFAFAVWLLIAWGISVLIGLSTDRVLLYSLAFAFVERLPIARARP